jgi:transposase-like protein
MSKPLTDTELVTRLTCPICGEYDRYRIVGLTAHHAFFRCSKCGRTDEWERTPDGWRVREEKE